MKNDQDKLLQLITGRLKKDRSLAVELPCGGHLHIDRPVPYLLVYRTPPEGEDTFHAALGKTESAYLIAPDQDACPIQPIVRTIANAMADRFGGFMLLEVWQSDRRAELPFKIHISQKSGLPIAEKLEEELQHIRMADGLLSGAGIERKKQIPSPPFHPPLFDTEEARKREIVVIGLEISPFYISRATGRPYPLFVRELREHFGKALRKGFFEFVRMNTSYSAAHFEMLGTTELHELVWEIDGNLAEYSNQFDFLLLVTPINAQEAWQGFCKANIGKAQRFITALCP